MWDALDSRGTQLIVPTRAFEIAGVLCSIPPFRVFSFFFFRRVEARKSRRPSSFAYVSWEWFAPTNAGSKEGGSLTIVPVIESNGREGTGPVACAGPKMGSIRIREKRNFVLSPRWALFCRNAMTMRFLLLVHSKGSSTLKQK